ncbi:family 61 putative glycoside hydrolase [Microthyrium microscopicum]|uniref:AA9 family lytic polysaccharide monooxygenase n=1 Tax=Microthyrium microscopicum TaxID=703497 RepID=A0A6A6TZK2_9PEZI|nr:family 61 putative glycoside hydrolase [Microthyrium microscopicum]
MKTTIYAASLLLAGSVSAHGGVISYTIDGKTYAGLSTSPPPGGAANTIQRSWAKLDPIRDPNSPNLACNSPGAPAKLSATATAGATITAKWNNWPHNSGPLLVWMTECKGDCSTFSPAGADWFKIYQEGLLSGTIGHGKWATRQMIENNESLSVKIPESLKPGNYLIRHETINLARAPAEFYPECAQLKVVGSGSASPSEQFRAKLPGAYHKSDSAFAHAYSDAAVSSNTKYVIPGPPVWTGN